MVETLRPDICVIGAGSGGLSVAAAAAAFGVEVVLVEKGEMGGDCLNYGCVPSKAMIAAAKHAHAVWEAPHFGVMAGADFDVSFAGVRDHVRSVIAAIAPYDSEERFTGLGVRVIRAEGRFTGPDALSAGGFEIRARRFVIATGSSPLVPPIPGLAETPHFTNETIFTNAERPGHLLVIGGGPIGLELAQAHRRLGSRVTVIEAARALAKEDPELAAIVLERLRAEGVEILEGAKVSSVARGTGGGVELTADQDGAQRIVSGSHLLVAVGRKANVAGLGLEQAGVEYTPKGVTVDDRLRTTNRRIFAIGDVAGSLQFTHVAGYHAGLVVRAILFRLTAKPDLSIIPWATYTDPEIAQVGLSEAQARERNIEVQVLRWPFRDNDRAQAEGKTKGMVKIVAGRGNRILGAAIAGPQAGELINFWALAVAKRLTLRDVASYVAPYPTLSEAGRRAATSAYAPYAKKPAVRWLVNFLRKFG